MNCEYGRMETKATIGVIPPVSPSVNWNVLPAKSLTNNRSKVGILIIILTPAVIPVAELSVLPKKVDFCQRHKLIYTTAENIQDISRIFRFFTNGQVRNNLNLLEVLFVRQFLLLFKVYRMLLILLW